MNFILGPQEPYKMQLKLFITTILLKSRIRDLFKDNLQTYTVTAYAFPSMKKDFMVDETYVCLVVIREPLFSYLILSISCLLHRESEMVYAENMWMKLWSN